MTLIIIISLILLELKTIRDVILFRFSISVFMCLPEWLQRWLRGASGGVTIDYFQTRNIMDGFHIMDGLIITLSIAAMIYLKYGLLITLWATPLWWILFYPVAFNFNYHWLHTQPEFRDLHKYLPYRWFYGKQHFDRNFSRS